MTANKNKKLNIKVGEQEFLRLPVKTHLITAKDDLSKVLNQYLAGRLQKNDLVFLSEKMVAISQNRFYPISQVRPSFLARFLSKFVSKRPGGIGLAMPETMQAALMEVGVVRILFACFGALITKPLGIKGVFYNIAGNGARAIDGPTQNTIAPYNNCVVKGPKNPQETAQKLSYVLKTAVAIVDVNDWGSRVIGQSKPAPFRRRVIEQALKDNPLGQCDESTPLGILRQNKTG